MTANIADLVGDYQLFKNENMNKYLSQSDVPFVVRKMIMSSTPHIEIRCDESSGSWEISIKTMRVNKVIKFKHGEEFTETGRQGAGEDKEARCTGYVDSDRLRITSKSAKGEDERTFFIENGQLVLHLRNKTKDVEARRFFKRA